MFIKVEYFLEGDYMNKKFIPGMVMLDGSITPGRSGDITIGGDEPDAGLVLVYENSDGETFILIDGLWYGSNGNTFEEPQEDWVLIS